MTLLQKLKIRLQKIRLTQLEEASKINLRNLEAVNSNTLSKDDELFLFI